MDGSSPGVARRVLFGLTALVAFGLALWGFASQPVGSGPSWNGLYGSIQVFVLEWTPPNGMNWQLQVARFLAPATTAFAVVETLRGLFQAELRRRRAARSRNHVVVCGDGVEAALVSRALGAEKRRVVLVGSIPDYEFERRHGALVVRGNPSDPLALRAAGAARATELYACAERGAANAAIVLSARALAHRGGHPVTAYARIRDGEMCTALRARRIGVLGDPLFRLGFFSIEDVAARVLLDNYPIASTAPDVMVVGSGGFARALLRELAKPRTGDDLPVPATTTVTVVTDEPEAELLAALPPRHADLPNITLATRCDLPTQPPAQTYVCLDDADASMHAGLSLVHSRAAKVVVCLRQRLAFAEAFASAEGVLIPTGRSN